jgi:hypothetical protein
MSLSTVEMMQSSVGCDQFGCVGLNFEKMGPLVVTGINTLQALGQKLLI